MVSATKCSARTSLSTRKATVLVAALLGLVAAGLSSCSLAQGMATELRPGLEINTSETVVAITINPQSNNFTGEGILILAEEDGVVSEFSHGGLDNGSVLWSDSGIFLSDVDQNYLLGDTVATSQAPRANLSIGAMELEPGTFVQLSNVGFTDSGGYMNDVVVQNGGESITSSLEGYVWQLADCGTSAIAVVETAGPLASADVDGPTVFTAYRLDAETAGEFIAVRDFAFTGELAQNPGLAECVDETLVWLSRTVDTRLIDGATGLPDGATGAAIVEWPLREPGVVSVTPLVDHNGAVAPELVDAALAGPGATVGSVLRWFAPDGSVRETDRMTGRTETLAVLVGPGGGDEPIGVGGLARFEGDCLWVLDIPSSGDVRLFGHDLVAGTTQEVVRVDGLADSLSLDRVLRGFAVNPAQRC